jgi:hypothetical protein
LELFPIWVELRVRSVSETPLNIESFLHAARSAEKNLEIFGGDIDLPKASQPFFQSFQNHV